MKNKAGVTAAVALLVLGLAVVVIVFSDGNGPEQDRANDLGGADHPSAFSDDPKSVVARMFRRDGGTAESAEANDVLTEQLDDLKRELSAAEEAGNEAEAEAIRQRIERLESSPERTDNAVEEHDEQAR